VIEASGGSMAAGVIHGGVVFQGAPAAVSVSWPVRVGVVPRAAECFQEREEVALLDAALAGSSTAVLCQVISGAGGVGKTQLAAHFARARAGVDLLVWVGAGSREAIVSEFARAGAVVTGAEMADPEQAAVRLLEWLAVTDRSWLVVLDDLANPGDLAGLWPPDRPAGRTVVTTRRRDAALTGAGRVRIEVDVFTADQAERYLTAKLVAHGRVEPAGQVAGLARDLGFLPMALAQAVAYLIDAGLDCARYRQRWADRRRRLARLVPQDGGLPDEQRQSVAAVWSLSTERADRLEPVGLARPMLELVSLLDPNGIPEQVLTSTPARRYAAAHRTRHGPEPVSGTAADDEETIDIEDAGDALRALTRLSLVTPYPGDPRRTVRVHAVLQRATGDSMTRPRREATARAAADALLTCWPEIEHDSALSQALRSNTDALYKQLPEPLWDSGVHPLLFRAGKSLGNSGLVTSAIDYWQDIAAQRT
jgi:NB-ARC domain